VQTMLNELEQRARPIQAAYQLLQEAAAPRRLVDKTPGYAMDLAILSRAEALFEKPLYIHLVRHPYAVIESFVRHRLHVVLGQPDADPVGLAELVWTVWHRNLLTLGRQMAPGRYLQISFEDLVSRPRDILTKVCDFLAIPFDEQVLNPYASDRMFGGPGDPDILQHDNIDPEPGYVWQNVRLPRPLRPETQALADAFGYEIPKERPGTATAAPDATPAPSDLDELSDVEVDALLREMLKDQ
jgi:hypothetical protein